MRRPLNIAFLLALSFAIAFTPAIVCARGTARFAWGDSYDTVIKKAKRYIGKTFIAKKDLPNYLDRNCKNLAITYDVQSYAQTEIYNICKGRLNNIVYPVTIHQGPLNANEMNYIRKLNQELGGMYNFVKETKNYDYDTYEYMGGGNYVSISYKSMDYGVSFIYVIFSSLAGYDHYVPNPKKKTPSHASNTRKPAKANKKQNNLAAQAQASPAQNLDLESISKELLNIRS